MSPAAVGKRDWTLSPCCKLSRLGGGGDRADVVRPVPWVSLDLIFKIALFLPFHKIYQLRTVCKAWNALLRSPALLDAWSTAPHEEWLVMARKLPGPKRQLSRQLIAYDPAADWWIPLQHLLDSCPSAALSTLGGSSLGHVPNPSLFGNVLFSLSPMAASSGVPGLACFLIRPFEPPPSPSSRCWQPQVMYSLLVLNLFNGSYRPLPPPLELFHRIVYVEDVEGSHLLVSMQRLPGNAYRVFLHFHNFGMPGPLEIYDSCRGSWNVGRSCDQPGDAKIASVADLKNADLLLYLTTTKTVFAYNVKEDEWSQVLGQFPSAVQLCFPTLVRHEGQVLLAAVLYAYQEPIFKGFIVWELHLRYSGSPPSAAVPGTPVADWVEVARTPERYWRGFYSADMHSPDKGVRIVSSGSLIYMTPVGEAEACNPPLVYDLVRNSWFHLSPSYAGSDPFMAAFSMCPSFAALA